MRLKCGELGFVSTVIIGLSLNCPSPVWGAKNVGVQVSPPSCERATAISGPLIDPPAEKHTPMWGKSAFPFESNATPGSEPKSKPFDVRVGGSGRSTPV